jgi:hypothetical protein
VNAGKELRTTPPSSGWPFKTVEDLRNMYRYLCEQAREELVTLECQHLLVEQSVESVCNFLETHRTRFEFLFLYPTTPGGYFLDKKNYILSTPPSLAGGGRPLFKATGFKPTLASV